MVNIRGVLFRDEDAPVVETLLARLIEKCGESLCYSVDRQIRFAIRPPDEPLKKNAYRIFIQIKSMKDGALLRRPQPPKTGRLILHLSVDTVEEAIRLSVSWFYEVRGLAVPIEYQATENSRVLAGGGFESNRSKH